MKYGITFPQELIAAGVGGLPMSWTEDGQFIFDDSITQEQRDTVLAVAAAHDPNAKDKKMEARVYLEQTDWYVVRFAETGTPIPDDIREGRAAARLILP